MTAPVATKRLRRQRTYRNWELARARCTVCQHPRVSELHAAALRAAPHPTLAGEYGLSAQAIGRHMRDHFPAILAMGMVPEAATETARFRAMIDAGIRRGEHLTTRAEREGDLRAAIAGHRVTLHWVRLFGNAVGELPEPPAIMINVLESPAFRRVMDTIIEATKGAPAVRAAIAAALEAEMRRPREIPMHVAPT